MMTHQNGSLCGAVVHAVFQFVRGGLGGVLHTPLLGQPAAIEDIAADQDSQTDDQNNCTIHKNLAHSFSFQFTSI